MFTTLKLTSDVILFFLLKVRTRVALLLPEDKDKIPHDLITLSVSEWQEEAREWEVEEKGSSSDCVVCWFRTRCKNGANLSPFQQRKRE